MHRDIKHTNVLIEIEKLLAELQQQANIRSLLPGQMCRNCEDTLSYKKTYEKRIEAKHSGDKKWNELL